MVKTHISLPPELHRRAKRRAAEEGVSLSELVRRGLESELAADARAKGDISAIFALGSSSHLGGSDIARHQDEYLAEAYQRDLERKMGRSDRRR